MGFKSCKKAVVASFSDLDLWAVLPPSKEVDEEEDEAEDAKGETISIGAIEGATGETVPTEASVLHAIEEVEVAVEEALQTTDEVETAIETPLAVEVIPLEGGILAMAHTEVPSSSWALGSSDNIAEVGVN